MFDDLRFLNPGETYLIVGANGFIGSSIVFALYEENRRCEGNPYKLILAVRNYEKALKKFGNILLDENIKIVIADNKDTLRLEENIDWIICATAVTKKEMFKNVPATTLTDNIFGILNCFELAKTKDVKGVVLISSVQVYGEIEKKYISENDFGKLNCMSAEAVYPESKRAGEMLAWAYSKQYHIPIKCVRLFHVYGEGEEYDNGTYLSDFLLDIIYNRDILIKGSGREIRNLCYITDVVRGILYVLHKGENGESYNVGSEKNNLSIKETAEILARISREVGRNCNVIVQNEEYTNGKIMDRQVPNVGKLKSLGWKEIDKNIEENLKKVIEEGMLRYLNNK